MIFADDIYLGGYSDFQGVSSPVTLHISGAAHAGGVAAVITIYALGMIIDYSTKNDQFWDRVACVIYYCAGVSAVAFFGLSKQIQAISSGLDVKGVGIDGALIASMVALVAHLYLAGAVLSNVQAFAKLNRHGEAWLAIGIKRETWINKKLLIRATMVAATLPLARGYVGYVFGFVAQMATFFVLKADSVFLAILGAQ